LNSLNPFSFGTEGVTETNRALEFNDFRLDGSDVVLGDPIMMGGSSFDRNGGVSMFGSRLEPISSDGSQESDPSVTPTEQIEHLSDYDGNISDPTVAMSSQLRQPSGGAAVDALLDHSGSSFELNSQSPDSLSSGGGGGSFVASSVPNKASFLRKPKGLKKASSEYEEMHSDEMVGTLDDDDDNDKGRESFGTPSKQGSFGTPSKQGSFGTPSKQGSFNSKSGSEVRPPSPPSGGVGDGMNPLMMPAVPSGSDEDTTGEVMDFDHMAAGDEDNI
jgi:hypothetical protein